MPTATTTPDQPDTAEPTMNAQAAVAAAQSIFDAAIAATAAANEGVTKAEQALAAAEAAVIDTLAAAAVATDAAAKSRITTARADVAKARDDVELAHLQRQAADVAYSRAAADTARAQRAITAEAYLEALRRHNDPSSKVNKLQAELPGLIAEFIELIEARDEQHARLAQEFQHFPEDERANVKIPAGQHLAGRGQTGTWPVFVRTRALVDILKAAGLEVGGR